MHNPRIQKWCTWNSKEISLRVWCWPILHWQAGYLVIINMLMFTKDIRGFSREPQELITDWILMQDVLDRHSGQSNGHLSWAPSVKEYHEPLWHSWTQYFISCNTFVTSFVVRKVEKLSVTATSSNVLCAFLQLSEKTQIEFGVQYERVYWTWLRFE